MDKKTLAILSQIKSGSLKIEDAIESAAQSKGLNWEDVTGKKLESGFFYRFDGKKLWRIAESKTRNSGKRAVLSHYYRTLEDSK